ncbi:hypothetical protein ACU8KH_00036 [Lachancea thermotolerans]
MIWLPVSDSFATTYPYVDFRRLTTRSAPEKGLCNLGAFVSFILRKRFLQLTRNYVINGEFVLQDANVSSNNIEDRDIVFMSYFETKPSVPANVLRGLE